MDTLDAGLAIGVVLLIFCMVVIAILIKVLYLLNLQNTLKLVSPQHRAIAPGQVWMELIPFFGIVWQFFVVQRVGASLKAEFGARGIATAEAVPGMPLGLIMCICICCCVLPFISILAGPAALVLLIIYWAKIAGYKRMLLNADSGQLKPSF